MSAVPPVNQVYTAPVGSLIPVRSHSRTLHHALHTAHKIPGAGLSQSHSQHQQVSQTGASASAREPARASHSIVRAALASDTVFGGTVDRLETFKLLQ